MAETTRQMGVFQGLGTRVLDRLSGSKHEGSFEIPAREWQYVINLAKEAQVAHKFYMQPNGPTEETRRDFIYAFEGINRTLRNYGVEPYIHFSLISGDPTFYASFGYSVRARSNENGMVFDAYQQSPEGRKINSALGVSRGIPIPEPPNPNNP